MDTFGLLLLPFSTSYTLLLSLLLFAILTSTCSSSLPQQSARSSKAPSPSRLSTFFLSTSLFALGASGLCGLVLLSQSTAYEWLWILGVALQVLAVTTRKLYSASDFYYLSEYRLTCVFSVDAYLILQLKSPPVTGIISHRVLLVALLTLAGISMSTLLLRY